MDRLRITKSYSGVNQSIELSDGQLGKAHNIFISGPNLNRRVYLGLLGLVVTNGMSLPVHISRPIGPINWFAESNVPVDISMALVERIFEHQKRLGKSQLIPADRRKTITYPRRKLTPREVAMYGDKGYRREMFVSGRYLYLISFTRNQTVIPVKHKISSKLFDFIQRAGKIRKG